MVDMNMLLITLYAVYILSKPQTMEISMPTKDKVTAEEQTKSTGYSCYCISFWMGRNLYFTTWRTELPDYKSLIESDYTANGLKQ